MQLGLDVSKLNGYALVLIDSFYLLIPLLFVWLAGTLPLQPVLVAANVAQLKNVGCSLFVVRFDQLIFPISGHIQ